MSLILQFEGIVMDCWHDDDGSVVDFLCIPANPCLEGYPLCLGCVVKEGSPGRIERETVFPGALVRVTAYELSDSEDIGTFNVWITPADVTSVTKEEERLALCEALVDPLLDAAMLGRHCWCFNATDGKIPIQELLRHCLGELKEADKLQPGRLTRRVHGWLSEYWLITAFDEKSTGIPGVVVCAALRSVGSAPRIFIAPPGGMSETTRDCIFSISISPRPRVLEGKIFVSEETLALCLAWVRLNRRPLLKHWRRRPWIAEPQDRFVYFQPLLAPVQQKREALQWG